MVLPPALIGEPLMPAVNANEIFPGTVWVGDPVVDGLMELPQPAAGSRKDPVGDDQVDAVAVQRQRRECAARLGRHHRLGGEDETHR